MSNIYHILSNHPAIQKIEMEPYLEELAQRLVNSGNLRIDAVDKINFARCYIPDLKLSKMFSWRELNDKHLLPNTKKFLIYHLSRKYSKLKIKAAVNFEIERLKKEILKYQRVNDDLEIKLARLIVQSAHPIVISLILLEQVELFVSYSYNISDVLDIVNWQTLGSNSGLQSSLGREYAIFVSAGGDPFAETQKGAIYGDGFPALARLMIIAAQEIGHYADIIKNQNGTPIGRHSCDLYISQSTKKASSARQKDINITKLIKYRLHQAGVRKLFEIERSIKFFIKNKRIGLLLLYYIIKAFFVKRIFIYKALKLKLRFVSYLSNEKYIASKLIAMSEDIAFNLAPKADVYQRENKVEEDAIACAEALARIPQQEIKWGTKLIKIFSPNLYALYYDEVIPQCIKYYEQIKATKFMLPQVPLYSKLIRFFYKLFKKKIKSYSIWNF